MSTYLRTLVLPVGWGVQYQAVGRIFDMGSFVAVNTETLLGMFEDDDTARLLETYHRAEAFRATLHRHSLYFSDESLLVASSLQNHLVKIG